MVLSDYLLVDENCTPDAQCGRCKKAFAVGVAPESDLPSRRLKWVDCPNCGAVNSVRLAVRRLAEARRVPLARQGGGSDVMGEND